MLSRNLELRMVALALLVAVILSLLSPFFLTQSNLALVLSQSVVVGIVALGMTLVVLTGGIDLSVGAVAGLAGIVFGLTAPHLPIEAAVAVAVLAGAGIGLLSGLMIDGFGLAAFAVTLGVMAMARSLAFILAGQGTLSAIPARMQAIATTRLAGVPADVMLLFGLYALAWIYLVATRGGRTLYAIGSNRRAARAAGLGTRLHSVLPYVLSGALAGLAGLVSVGQLMFADPQMGTALALDALAAVLIGGASLHGGRGSVLGTLAGVFILVMIRNGFNLLGISALWQGVTVGSLIGVAVLVDRFTRPQTSEP